MAKEFLQKFATLITGAFSFLAALAWNDTIKAFIQKYISPGSDVGSMFVYALIVTLIAILISYYMNQAVEKLTKQEKKIEKRMVELEEKILKHEIKEDKQKQKRK